MLDRQEVADKILLSRRLRGAAANAFLEVVANCGKGYFKSAARGAEGRVSAFQVDRDDCIWFTDFTSGNRIQASWGIGAYKRLLKGQDNEPILSDVASKLGAYVFLGINPGIDGAYLSNNSREWTLINAANKDLVAVVADENNNTKALQFSNCVEQFNIDGMGRKAKLEASIVTVSQLKSWQSGLQAGVNAVNDALASAEAEDDPNEAMSAIDRSLRLAEVVQMRTSLEQVEQLIQAGLPLKIGVESKSKQEIIDEVNALAAKFYPQFDAQAKNGHKFYEAAHPQEVAVWNMACLAYEHINEVDVRSILDEMLEDVDETRSADKPAH